MNRNNDIKAVSFFALTLIATAILTAIVIGGLTVLALKFLLPSSAFTGEGGLIAFFLLMWVVILSVPLSIIFSYTISMRLAVYLREKRGWEIRHPRKLFLVSLLLVATTSFALLLR